MARKKKYEASPGHVIVQVLKPFTGMTRDLKKGDIIEVRESQAKEDARAVRKGYFKPYTKGDKKPLHR